MSTNDTIMKCNSIGTSITNFPSTEIGKKLSQECGAKVINMTQVTTQQGYDNAADMIFKDLTSGVRMMVIEEPAYQPTQPNMLSYYHPKNGGEIQEFLTEVWFDQNTSWFKNQLVPSGIQYPTEWFMIMEIPDDPNGNYRLAGSFGGSITIAGNAPYISTRHKPKTKKF